MGERALEEFECSLRNDVLGELEKRLKQEQHRRWQLQDRIKELEVSRPLEATSRLHPAAETTTRATIPATPGRLAVSPQSELIIIIAMSQ